MQLVAQALAAPRDTVDDLPTWLARTEADLAGLPPIHRAIRGAARADRVGAAFAVAYRAALAQLVPGQRAAALCVTEVAGNHPRALTTTARHTPQGVELTGAKVWATLADRAETLLIAAVEGERDGRPAIGVYAVPASHSGVELTAMPPPPFVPEVPHFGVEVDAMVPADSRLDGDGWADLVKPFRTVEDLFVTAAMAAFGLRRRDEAGYSAVITGLVALSEADPRAPSTHLALAGLMDQAHALLPALADGDPRLAQDLGLLKIGGKARAARLHRARVALGLEA